MEMPPGPPIEGTSSSPPGSVPEPAGAPDQDGLLADEATNRRLVLVVAVLALLGVIGMVAGFVANRAGDEESAEPSATFDAPSATTAPPPVDEEALDDLLPELQAFVEEERELEFREEIDLTLLDEQEYLARAEADFLDDLDEDEDAVVSSALALQALGLWPPGTDPVEILGRFVSGGSLGYYDPETGEMVVRGTALTPLLRSTLVHELTHALDDQHLELHRPELDDRPDESSTGFGAVVEGNAQRVDEAYEAGFTPDERAAAAAEEQALVEGFDFSSFPPILLAQQQFLYQQGRTFVARVFADGGNEAVTRALRRPPTTSEQLLEPDVWPDREPIADVAVPDADGEVVEDGVVGQFLLHLLGNIDPTAQDGPEWGGDNSVLWRDGDEACLRIHVAGDLDGFEESLATWAAGAGAELDRVGDRLEITACN